MNIVLVEDSLAIRRLLLSYLDLVPGAHVTGEAASEAHAIEVIQRTNPDLVLLDISLSPGSGISVLREVRAGGHTGKILVLTHQPLEAYRIECEALGADGFHDKGTDIDLIMRRVRGWIAEEQRAAVNGMTWTQGLSG